LKSKKVKNHLLRTKSSLKLELNNLLPQQLQLFSKMKVD
jgi:hypothetical protein